MASFVGSNNEFRKYLGIFVNDLVVKLARLYKAEVGKCQHCGSLKDLEVSQIYGKDVSNLIDKVLDPYVNNELVTIDLSVFEEKFKEECEPLYENIIVLCRKCKDEYENARETDNVIGYIKGRRK